MARRKFNYKHIINGKEVTKDEFKNALARILVRCDTNYDNPFLNISYTDYDAVEREYNRMRRTGIGTLYSGHNGYFKIKREEVK